MISLDTIIPTVIVLAILLSIIASIFIKPDHFQKSRVYVFVSMMASAAVFILALNLVVSTSNLEMQKKINKLQFTKESIDKLWLYPNQIIAEKKNARPEFLASLYYNNADLYRTTLNANTPSTPQSELDEQFISIVLIQCWEDYLTFRFFDETGDMVWFVNFLQWAQSPYLRKQFDNLKYNFAQTTIDIGHILFEYASKIPVPSRSPETYRSFAMDLLKDPRVAKVFEDRQKG